MKPLIVACMAMGLAGAPFQCASDPDPNRRVEDSAPQALWELSERFEAQGNERAQRETLRHLIERYPSSRFARRAELALEPDDRPADDDGGGEHAR